MWLELLPPELLLKIIHEVDNADLLRLLEMEELEDFFDTWLCYIVGSYPSLPSKRYTPSHEYSLKTFNPDDLRGRGIAVVELGRSCRGALPKLLQLNSTSVDVRLIGSVMAYHTLEFLGKEYGVPFTTIVSCLEAFHRVTILDSASSYNSAFRGYTINTDVFEFSRPGNYGLQFVNCKFLSMSGSGRPFRVWDTKSLVINNCSGILGSGGVGVRGTERLKSLILRPTDLQSFDAISYSSFPKLNMLETLELVDIHKFSDRDLPNLKSLVVDCSEATFQHLNLPSLVSLSVRAKGFISFDDVRLPCLKKVSLDFTSGMLEPEQYEAMDISCLNRAEIELTIAGENSCTLLCQTPRIQTLELKTKIRNTMAKVDPKLDRLTSLVIHDPTGFRAISKFLSASRSLTSLTIHRSYAAGEEHLSNLENSFPKLSKLTLVGIRFLGSIVFNSVKELYPKTYPNSVTIGLKGCRFTALTVLVIKRGPSFPSQRLTEFEIEAPNLKSLHIERFKCERLKIDSFPKLRYLALNHGIRSLHLEHLESLKELELLYNPKIKITHCCRLKSLRRLWTSGTTSLREIKDSGLDAPLLIRRMYGSSKATTRGWEAG